MCHASGLGRSVKNAQFIFGGILRLFSSLVFLIMSRLSPWREGIRLKECFSSLPWREKGRKIYKKKRDWTIRIFLILLPRTVFFAPYLNISHDFVVVVFCCSPRRSEPSLDAFRLEWSFVTILSANFSFFYYRTKEWILRPVNSSSSHHIVAVLSSIFQLFSVYVKLPAKIPQLHRVVWRRKITHEKFSFLFFLFRVPKERKVTHTRVHLSGSSLSTLHLNIIKTS